MRAQVIWAATLMLFLAPACSDKGGGGEDAGASDGGGGEVTPFEVLLESHGTPAWKPEGFQFFSAPMGDQAGGFLELGETLTTLLAGENHALDPDFEVVVPAQEHAPPYDEEWVDAVSAAGFVHSGGFLDTQFDAPGALFLTMVLVPTEGAPTGDTPSGAGLPLIENATFPINMEGTISRVGQIVDGNVDGQYPAPTAFVPPLGPDGLSHVPLWMVEQSSFFTVTVDTPGLYEWQVRLLDSQGLGWTVSVPFSINQKPAETDGGTTSDGGTSTLKSCREGGVCDPDRYTDTAGGPYATGAYPNMLLRKLSGQFLSSNHDGEIVNVAGVAEGQSLRYWLMTRSSDQGKLADVFGTAGYSVGRLFQFVDKTGAPLGTPVLELAPDSGNFSPLVQVMEVEAVDGYTADGIKSATTLRFARRDPAVGLIIRGTDVVRALWPVDPTVALQDGPVAGGPTRITVWYEKQSVEFLEAPGSGPAGTMAVTASTDPDTIPPTVALGDLWQFTGAGGAPCGGGNVFAAKLGSAAYTPMVHLHLTTAPDCASVPGDGAAVEAGIAAGTFTVTDTFGALLPQVP